jgi:rhodanese-related sulfurtransferase
MTYQTVAPTELHKRICEGATVDLVDVRTPKEFQSGHVLQARNVPLDQLAPEHVVAERTAAPSEPIYLICKSGLRARQAADKFVATGRRNVVLVDGSMEGWRAEGLPVHSTRKFISVDCQTRIAVGTMVLLGIALALLVSPGFLVISGFAGCGLIFAGLFDSCPLANVIARMPWNYGVPVACGTNRPSSAVKGRREAGSGVPA